MSVDFDSGTDTNTSSDDSELGENFADLAGMTEAQAIEQIFWQYRHAKRRWCKYAQKPLRRAGGFVRRRGGKGGGKSRTHLINEGPIATAAFSNGQGKGKGSKGKGKSSGFGCNRRRHPEG